MTMGHTLAEKLVAAHLMEQSRTEVWPGDLVEVGVDMALSNDITAPIAIREFEKLGVERGNLSLHIAHAHKNDGRVLIEDFSGFVRGEPSASLHNPILSRPKAFITSAFPIGNRSNRYRTPRSPGTSTVLNPGHCLRMHRQYHKNDVKAAAGEHLR